MAQVKRSETHYQGDSVQHRAVADHRYDAGGHIAQLQADLADRLMSQGAGHGTAFIDTAFIDTPGERMVRFVSVAGGYTALLAGYAVAAMVIAHWL